MLKHFNHLFSKHKTVGMFIDPDDPDNESDKVSETTDEETVNLREAKRR